MGLQSKRWQCAILYRVVWEDLSITLIYEQEPEESEGVRHVAI